MKSIRNHIKVADVYFGRTPDENKEKNTRKIKEELLRLAVNHCENYATDILNFFDTAWQFLIKGQLKEVVLYFNDVGISWNIMRAEYHCKATLIRNLEHDSLELYVEEDIPEYPDYHYLVEFLEDFKSPSTELSYKKGQRVIAFRREEMDEAQYWVAGIMDQVPAKIIRRVCRVKYKPFK